MPGLLDFVRTPPLPKPGEKIGLIAGTGNFARLVAQALQARGYSLAIAGFEQENGALKNSAAEYREFTLADGEKALAFLKNSGIRYTLMAGALPKKKVYSEDYKPDGLTRSVLSAVDQKGDDRLLKAVMSVLKLSGIKVLNPADLLPDRLVPKGVLTRRAVSAEEMQDVEFGRKTAKAIGYLDIGQTVIVKAKTVWAVEGIEGTDETIKRVGAMGLKGGVVVKVSKPQQDLRFDMPVIGSETVRCAARAGCAVLAVEAGKAFFLEREEAIRLADEGGISLIGI